MCCVIVVISVKGALMCVKMITLLSKLAKEEGINKTFLPQVHVYRTSESNGRESLVYNQGIIFVPQGKKNIYLENKQFCYDRDNFLILTVPLPLECEPVLMEGKPLLGMAIDIDSIILNNVINTMGRDINLNNFRKSSREQGIYTSKVDKNFDDIILRLLSVLQDETDARVLGPSLLREFIYRLLCRDDAAPLFSLASQNTSLSKIELALKEIHLNFQSEINVPKLASIASMSVSSFHHTFKDVTSTSPIQYIKKIRLSKAKEFMTDEGMRVNEAARAVGYESLSQFSREFKRYFGNSPGEYVRS